MITKLKYKIFIGVLLLSFFLAASAGMVLYQYVMLNKSIGALVEDNYKSILACQKMADALEREDSGILMLLIGNQQEGRAILNQADSSFQASLAISRNNLTEENELEFVNDISAKYEAFKALWSQPIINTEKEGNIGWYSSQVYDAFLAAKGSVNALLLLNQQSMYEESSALNQKTRQAILPGIASIVAVLVFAFVFNFFLSRSFVSPLYRLIEAAKSFRANQPNFSPKIKSKDEFKDLENGIQDIIVKINRFHEKS